MFGEGKNILESHSRKLKFRETAGLVSMFLVRLDGCSESFRISITFKWWVIPSECKCVT